MNEWIINTIKIIMYSDYANDYKVYLLDKIVMAHAILTDVEREIEEDGDKGNVK